MKRYADEIRGQYIEYTQTLSVIIVPVPGNRFQTVMGTIKQSSLYNRKVIIFTSKVCPMNESIDFKMLLEQTAFFNYCRFMISENYLQVEAVSSLSGVTEEDIKEMLQEVANIADQYEMKISGTDIH
jgi:predicted lactoylglutathione lyase